jgi:hypothetical protein
MTHFIKHSRFAPSMESYASGLGKKPLSILTVFQEITFYVVFPILIILAIFVIKINVLF